jgi:hypothetical protein
MARDESEIPNNMRKVYRSFQRWRSSHTGRLAIPEPLWAGAADVAREQGVLPTAKALRLEYGKLKQWVEAAGRVAKAPAVAPRRARSRPAAFVELIAPRPAVSPKAWGNWRDRAAG